MHIGLCFTTTHFAFTPHDPLHGSMHFWLLHALFCRQSELTTHSGRHVGGLPIYPGVHVHTACPLISRHWLFGPQGDGTQGLLIIGTEITLNLILILTKNMGNRRS